MGDYMGCPTSFRSLKEAARYIVRIHAGIALRFPDRPHYGTELAGYLLARSMLSEGEIAEIEADAQAKRHTELWNHALEVVYG